MSKPSFKFFLGIDLAKAKFNGCLMDNTSRVLARGEFPNNPQGFALLLSFLHSHLPSLRRLLCILEATGHYGRKLENFLVNSKLAYSQVNPAQIKYHARRCLSRTKTDPADARLIADFGRRYADELILTTPLAPHHRQLQALVREMEALVDQCTATKNRLTANELPQMQSFIQEQIDFLTRQIHALEAAALKLVKGQEALLQQFRLLCSIKGIAARTALRILAEIAGKVFQDARQLAAYAGLTSCHRQSGESVNGKTRLCKTGNAKLRTALYLPAQSARRHCLELGTLGR